MGRNAMSRFGLNPTINRPRSSFTMDHSHKTTLNFGDLVPIFVQECYPGDTHKVRTNFVMRLQTLLTPVMDNMYLDTFFFFVPFRLVHDHFVNIMGENDDSPWIPQIQYSTPQTTAPSGGWNEGSIADYIGIPPGIDNISVSSYYFRAYAKIVEDWFRDQNVQDPIVVSTGDSTTAGSNGTNYISDLEKGGMPFIASRYRDYFSTCLPDPQKGQPVTISLGNSVPVFGNGYALALTDSDAYFSLGRGTNTIYAYNPDVGIVGNANSSAASGGQSKLIGVRQKSSLSDPKLSGLIADISEASAISVNTLRLAFQLQKILETDARGGSRYISLLLSHFNVKSPDARLQRSEYLGGVHQPVNVNQVLQTSESNTTPLGSMAAYSHTSGSHGDFTYSCTEHGVIMGLAVLRYDHTYQQGLDRMFTRKTRYDYMWPALSNIGEQPVKYKELYLQSDSVVDSDGNIINDQVFGYQEPWADLRTRPNRVSAEMRSTSLVSLDSWHLADDYSSLPTLSASWMKEDKANVDRVLAVTSSVANQAFVDFYFQQKSVRCLPVYSIPGLIDHM